jgi:hypothetical protein
VPISGSGQGFSGQQYSFSGITVAFVLLSGICLTGFMKGYAWAPTRALSHLTITETGLNQGGSLSEIMATRPAGSTLLMTAQKTRDDGLDQGGLHTIRPSDCCNFTSQVVDKGCPRFIKFQWTASAGLGDRFFQYIMMLKMGMDMHAVPGSTRSCLPPTMGMALIRGRWTCCNLA